MEVITKQVSENLTKFGDAAQSAAEQMDKCALSALPELRASIEEAREMFVEVDRKKMIEARRAHREKRITGSIGRKGTRNRRIIHVEVRGDREYRFHATKGWRVVRAD